MTTATQRERAAHFRRLHARRPLVLPNAWDAATARIIERAGAAAIGTTSAAVSWAYGRGDGQTLERDEMIDAVARIAGAVSVPLTADVESGYGAGSPNDVARTVRAVVAAGAAGINLEDAPGPDGEPLLAPAAHADRIRAAREAAAAAAADLVVNARTDVFLARVGAPETRLDAAVRRANAYLAAGADCVFVPGVTDAPTIAALARDIDGPLNIMAGPGAPAVAELGALGVARVSVGPAFALVALAAVHRAAHALLHDGAYHPLESSLPFGEVDGLWRPASGGR